MTSQIRQKLRRIAASLGVVVASVFVAIPLGNCDGQLGMVLPGSRDGTPAMDWPPPGNRDVDGVDFITFGDGTGAGGLGNTARWPDGTGSLVTARKK